MKTGPPPEPTVLKMLKGNPGKRALNDAEPVPPSEMPRCPAHLDKAAKKCWRRLAADLHRMGVLSKIDGDALAIYCQAHSRWCDANENIEKAGMVLLVGENKYPVVSPYVTISNAAFKQMQAMLAEFGMTPSSRTQIRAGVKSDQPKGGVMSRKRAVHGGTDCYSGDGRNGK